MPDEHDLIYSPLQQTYSAGGHQVEIHIYRMPDTGWSLEVVDEHNNSTVWEDLFETDEEALAVALQELNEDGIDAFIARGPNEPMH
jgi:hypothetical protein